MDREPTPSAHHAGSCGHGPDCNCGGGWSAPVAGGSSPPDVDAPPLPAGEAAGLANRAVDVLDGNWTGRFTRPSPDLYRHQWSWDSAFISLAYAHYDQERAEQELRSLFDGQWSSGLVPHIVFDDSEHGYFPGPEVWGTIQSPHAPARPRTSGIVQPPAHAIAVWHLYQAARDRRRAAAFLEEMFPKLAAWHDYLYRERDPGEEGLVYIHHPWESGRDNSPVWDVVLDRVPGTARSLPRSDLQVVAADQRPSDLDYRRYLALVELSRENAYEQAEIRNASPFLVQDVLFNTLLVEAGSRLADVARVLGESHQVFAAQAARTADALNAKLWEPDLAQYFAWDLVADAPIRVHVAAGFTPLYAGVPTPEQAASIVDRLAGHCSCLVGAGCWAVPSYDKQADDFAPSRYWRGPIWVNMNWLLLLGARRYGYHAHGARLLRGIVELVRRSGFREYYNADNQQGLGAGRFSWTAALLLDLLIHEGVAVSTRG